METKEEFDDSCNDEPMFIINKEPVDEYDISQCSLDEIVYPKASEPEDIPVPICWRIGDECVIGDERFIVCDSREIYAVESLSGKYTRNAYADDMKRPEQIEAEEREKALDDMADSIMDRSNNDVGIPWKELLGHLYDAGYRKTK